MKDSSRASIPFAFDDLGAEQNERPRRGFVTLFRTEASEAEAPQTPVVVEAEQPAPSLEDMARKAFEDAYAQGEKAGHDMGMRRVDALARRIERQIEEVASFRKVLEEKYEKLAVELALMFAEAIVLGECAEKKDILAAMIRRAMEMCDEKGDIVIRVRSEDAGRVQGIGLGRVKVVADDTLGEPGFTIETAVGDIDGRISSQIEELKAALIGYHAG